MQSTPRRHDGRAWVLAGLLALGALSSGQPGSAQAPAGPRIDQRREFDVAGTQRHTTLVSAGAVKAPNGPTLTGVEVRQDALTGSASRVRRPGGALTGPGAQSPLTIARGFLAANRPVFQLSGADVTALQPVRQYHSPDLGVTHLTLQPVHSGIPVLQARVKFDLKVSGELLTVAGAAIPDLAGTVNTVTPQLSARQGLRAAAEAVGVAGPALHSSVPPVAYSVSGARRKSVFAANTLYERGPVVQLSYVPVKRGETRLAWETTLWRRGASDVFHVAVDAVTGALLLKNNYTDEAQGPVFDREAPQDGSPFPGGTPPVLARVVKTFDGSEFFAVGNPHRDWWGGSAQVSTDANNVSTGSFRNLADFIPAVAATGDFNFALNLALEPVTYRQAAIVNLFYWNNRCHDVWYGFGFNEAAGNFQKNNFGQGGLGNDHVFAATQFGADSNPPSRNNANFSTPPDGQNAVMRMFEFDLTSPRRDSDLAADVIAHEFGHGLTNRLIGNSDGLGGFQGGAMGEGLSDFQALMVHAQAGDDLSQPHPSGGWLVNDFAGGIRSQPYSANRANFNRTFADVGEVIPNFGPEIHLAGEIICNAMFQTYGRFVTRLGFAEGRSRAMQLFIDACKLCPDNPTFLDFRNALLTADQTRFTGSNTADIWFAFAAHGMGVNAFTTGVEDTNPVEDFTVPGAGGTLPAAPSNFDASLVNATTVDCTWSDNSSNETSFLLEASINAAAFAEVPQIAIGANATSTQITLTNFNPGDVLALRIKAVNGSGKSPVSNTDTVTIPGGNPVPSAPSSFDAELISSTRLDCTWADNATTETHFLLEASFDLGPWLPQPQITIPANSTLLQLSLTGFDPGDQLGLRIRAVNGSGQSLPSNSDTVVIPGGPAQTPTAPSNFNAALQGTTLINCSWTDNSSNETGFLLEASINGGTFTEQPSINIPANATTVQLQLTGFTGGDQIALRIKAFNASGSSGVSNNVTVTIPAAQGPTAPSSFVATLSGTNTVSCTWADNSSDETGFRLEFATNGGAFQEVATVVIKKNKRAARLTLTGFTPGDQVALRIKALGVSANSAPSNASTVTLPLPPPASLKAKAQAGTAGSTAVTLTFKDQSTGEAGFKVEGAGPSGVFVELGTVPANTTAVAITALTPGTAYKFRVRAYLGALNSTYSNIASVKTKR
ncbi:MAG: hypothetical protein K0Q72_96 [Armatimonadetes bacterium]|nr:hypothetical protein [Armatimonadota bacterium]